MKKDIDLRDLIKIVSDIEHKYDPMDDINEDKTFNNKSKIENIFDTDMDTISKLNELKLYEQRYPITSPKSFQDLFYEEAKLLENITLYEDYYNSFYSSVGVLSQMDTYMSYKKLSILELKRYLTWRTKLRKGIFTFTNSKFIYIYVNEIYRNIGVKDSEEGFDILMFMLDNLMLLSPRNENIFKKIVLEYIYYYKIDVEKTKSFDNFKKLFVSEIISKDNINNNKLLLTHIYDNFNSKSVFFNAHKNKIKECLNLVLEQIKTRLSSRNESIYQLLYKEKIITEYYFYIKHFIPENEIKKDSYHPLFDFMYDLDFKDNYYMVKEYYYESKYNLYMRYIINRIENIFRTFEHEKELKLKIPTLKNMDSSIDIVLLSKETLDIIDLTTYKYINNFNSKSEGIEIDFSKLDYIRDISNEVSEKLITDFDKEEEQIEIKKPEIVLESNDSFINLKESLDELEIKFLNLIIEKYNYNQIKEFLNKNNILLEVIVDRINEKSMDIIEDNILEIDDTEIIIYEEYIDDLKRVFKGE